MAQEEGQSVAVAAVAPGSTSASQTQLGAASNPALAQSSNADMGSTSSSLSTVLGNNNGGPNGYSIRPNYQQKFKVPVVQKILGQVVAEHLTGVAYSMEQCSQLSRAIADECRDRLKALGWSRYKYAVTVVLGERKGEGARMSARCLWDQDADNYAQELFLSDTLFCTVAAFGVYYY